MIVSPVFENDSLERGTREGSSLPPYKPADTNRHRCGITLSVTACGDISILPWHDDLQIADLSPENTLSKTTRRMQHD